MTKPVKTFWRNVGGILLAAGVLVAVAAAVQGCKAQPKNAPSREAATVESGNTKANIGLDTADRLIDKIMTIGQLPGEVPGMLRGVKNSVALARQGVKEQKAACDVAVQQADEGTAKENAALFKARMTGIFAFAFGVAAMIVCVKLDGVAQLIGYAIAAFGATLFSVTWFMRVAGPALVFLAWGAVVIALAGLAFLVYYKLRVRKRMMEEKNATKELSARLPEHELQNVSPTTQKLVAKARAEDDAEVLRDQAKAASGLT